MILQITGDDSGSLYRKKDSDRGKFYPWPAGYFKTVVLRPFKGAFATATASNPASFLYLSAVRFK